MTHSHPRLGRRDAEREGIIGGSRIEWRQTRSPTGHPSAGVSADRTQKRVKTNPVYSMWSGKGMNQSPSLDDRPTCAHPREGAVVLFAFNLRLSDRRPPCGPEPSCVRSGPQAVALPGLLPRSSPPRARRFRNGRRAERTEPGGQPAPPPALSGLGGGTRLSVPFWASVTISANSDTSCFERICSIRLGGTRMRVR